MFANATGQLHVSAHLLLSQGRSIQPEMLAFGECTTFTHRPGQYYDRLDAQYVALELQGIRRTKKVAKSVAISTRSTLLAVLDSRVDFSTAFPQDLRSKCREDIDQGSEF